MVTLRSHYRSILTGLIGTFAVLGLTTTSANAAPPDLVGDGTDTLQNALTANLGTVIPAVLGIVAVLIGIGFLVSRFRAAVR